MSFNWSDHTEQIAHFTVEYLRTLTPEERSAPALENVIAAVNGAQKDGYDGCNLSADECDECGRSLNDHNVCPERYVTGELCEPGEVL